jgi:hypothetical protein
MVSLGALSRLGRVAVMAGGLLATCSLSWTAPSVLAVTPVPTVVPAPAPGVVCPERRSNRVDFSVENFLSSPVALRASDINCSDWSNTGNPSNIDGVQVPAAGRHTWTMELGRGRIARWRLNVEGGTQAPWTGSAPLMLHLIPYSYDVVTYVMGGTIQRIGQAICSSKRIAPTSEPASTSLPTFQQRMNEPRLLIYSDGSHIVVSVCSRYIRPGLIGRISPQPRET